jgi:putative transport protein
MWLVNLLRVESVAQATMVLGLVVGAGLGLGSLRIRKTGLGIAGVLFSGLFAGHLLHRADIHLNPQMLDFAREFGLTLFVYTIGIQVGPGFLASLRRQGLPLNLMAAAIVFMGAAMTLAVWRFGQVPLGAAVGLFSGATTNTPSLAAAQEALKGLPSPQDLALPGMGYAVAYPFGIIGIILTMVLVRVAFRISPQRESEALSKMLESDKPKLAGVDLEVQNGNLEGLAVVKIPGLIDSPVVISRILSHGVTQVPTRDTLIHMGDVLHMVGPCEELEQFRIVIGRESKIGVTEQPANITTRRILVTKSRVLGETVADLHLSQRFGVMATRVSRADLELPPAGTRLQFGDTVQVVGEEAAIARVSSELGDSVKQLNYPQVIPIFLGIALGVIVGSWPLNKWPFDLGMPAAIKLGLAGGPLIVAIVLSRLGNVGPLVWYMPASANFMVRELGIALFLAAVGIHSGGGFWSTLTSGPGCTWMALAALITLVPLVVVALSARLFYKLNFLTLCGLLAGSMTDPPALTFATQLTGSEAASISYATVYPLVMVLRVVSAQVLVLLLGT